MTVDQAVEPAAPPTTSMVYRPDPRGAAWCVLLDSSGRRPGDPERERLRTALSVYAIAASAGALSASASAKGRHPYDIERWKWILARMPFLNMQGIETMEPLRASYLDLASGLLPGGGGPLARDAGGRPALLGALASAADRDLAAYPHVCLVLEIGVDAGADELTGRVRLRMTGVERAGDELTCSGESLAGEFTGFSERQKDRWRPQEAKYATPENLAALRAARHYAERAVAAS